MLFVFLQEWRKMKNTSCNMEKEKVEKLYIIDHEADLKFAKVSLSAKQISTTQKKQESAQYLHFWLI